jgi:hypothetical protein
MRWRYRSAAKKSGDKWCRRVAMSRIRYRWEVGLMERDYDTLTVRT